MIPGGPGTTGINPNPGGSAGTGSTGATSGTPR
jgi:hypothetical protein